jgi:hypothetical protein
MAHLLLEIFRFPSDRQLAVISYYVLLDHRPQRAQSRSSQAPAPPSGYRRPISSTDNRTALAQPTPEAAIQDMQQKLEQCMLEEDTIEYLGEVYPSVATVVQAVAQSRTKWV